MVQDRKLLPVEDAPTTSLLTVIRGCFIEPDACHRAAMYDRYGAIVDVVSQLDVLAFIHTRLSEKGFQDPQVLTAWIALWRSSGFFRRGVRSFLSELTRACWYACVEIPAQLHDLGVLLEPYPLSIALIPTRASPPLVRQHALSKMKKEGVSSAPVIAGDSEAMIANLSLSDLAGRTLRPEHFGVLALPVAEFLALVHGTAYIGYSRTSYDSNHPYFASQGSSSHPRPPTRMTFRYSP